MNVLSIRWRLTLWYGLTLTALLIALGTTVYVVLSHRLMARTDLELDEELVELALEIRLAKDHVELRRQLEDRFARHESFDFQLLEPGGASYFRSERLRTRPLAAGVPRPMNKETAHVIQNHPDLGALRIANRAVRALDREFVMQAVARLATDRRELTDFAQMMLTVGPLGLLGALSIGYLLARTALAPVDQMTAVAERITVAQLAERITPAHQHDELGRLARTLNRMLDRLQAAVEELRRFTADAAHELRTPLAVLRTEVEVALQSHRTPEEYQKTLNVVLEEIDRLTRLTNQLLMLSRHDAGVAGASHEPVELASLVLDVCDQLQGLASERGVSLELQECPLPAVNGDDLQLSQLFFNLIENALKYTPVGGSVTVFGRAHADHVEVCIADTGIGIAEEHLRHVVRRFYRVDASRNREAGGTGLGLAICEAIVTAHGGRMEIASSVSIGTSVNVWLPRAGASSVHDVSPVLQVSGAMVSLVLMAVSAGGLSGCQRTTAAPTKANASPSKVAHPVSETQLNTVELLPEAVQRLGLETATVEQRELSRVRPYGAELMLPGGAAVIVSAPVTGTLQIPHGKTFPQPGLKVTVGESLFDLLPMLSPERAVLTPAERIRFAEARNTIEQSRIDATGQVQQARVQVEAAEIMLARAERLLREQAGTVRAVDDAKAQLSLAQKALEAATRRQKLVDGIDLESPETGTVKSLAIAAPLDGQVRTIQVRPGEMVAAGSPLFEIRNTEILWLRVPVYAGEVAEIATTEPALLMALDGRSEEKPIVAPPMELPPTSAPLAAAVDLYYEVDNAAGNFRPGERLTAQLKLQGSQSQTTLPWSAVIHDIYGGQWVYEQVDAGKYVRRRIEVEWVQDGQAVLRCGPNVGVKVVTAGAAELAGTEFDFKK